MKRDLPENRTAWLEYERQKAAWVQNNPNATAEEYQAAMARIAKEVGV